LESGAYDISLRARDADGSVSGRTKITIPVYAPPTLTSVSAKRTSDAAATVTFAGDTAGAYYYAVAESGAAAPAIDTSGAGTEFEAGNVTITLTGLSSGAKDVYILAKNVDGDVSKLLVINIPAHSIIVESPEDETTPPVITITPGADSVKIADGAKTVEIKEGVLSDIADVISSTNEGSTPPVIEINLVGTIDKSDALNKSQISLPVKELNTNILEKIGTEQNVKITVLKDVCEVAIDKGVLKTVIDAADGEAVSVDIVAEKKDKENLGLEPAQEDVLADDKFRDVYDISVWVNGGKLDDFKEDDGKLTIGLPYKLEGDESGANVWAYHIDDSGWADRMTKGRFYDDMKEMTVFETDHLSVYATAYEQSASSDGGGCDAGSGVLALAVLALLSGIRRRGK
ncbi:MAG: hypothetical protein LBG12_12630, partial [Synergistaceae bacterium]|nr:hypothetical protein [Synergistaceae bacterium]